MQIAIFGAPASLFFDMINLRNLLLILNVVRRTVGILAS
jgi:hypothetical protein